MTDAAKQRQEGLAGAVRAHGAGATERPPHAPPPSRECDECTHCCSGVLRLEVDGEVIRPGHGCRHCQTSGCGIYASRPAVCRDFVCGWLRDDSALPPWLRPDRSGMILLPAYRRWCGVPVDVAVAAGTGARPEALRWLKRFSETHRRPLLYQLEIDGPWIGFGPAAFLADLRLFLAQGGSLFKS